MAIFECMFHSSRMMLMLMITCDADDESSFILAQLQITTSTCGIIKLSRHVMGLLLIFHFSDLMTHNRLLIIIIVRHCVILESVDTCVAFCMEILCFHC